VVRAQPRRSALNGGLDRQRPNVGTSQAFFRRFSVLARYALESLWAWSSTRLRSFASARPSTITCLCDGEKASVAQVAAAAGRVDRSGVKCARRVRHVYDRRRSRQKCSGLERGHPLGLARQSGELRATVIDALAHEFKTPLTSLKAAAGGLAANVPADAREREFVSIISEETDRLQMLVTDAIQMLRIDSGAFTVHRERHDLAKLVTGTLAEVRAYLDGRAVVSHVQPDLTVDADGDLLRLALRQLLDNAAKYSPATAAIEVGAEGVPSLDLVVRNSGAHIPAREHARIFERFYRGANARLVPGNGMGLAIVQQIALAHGGAVTVRSTPDEGTAVTLSLPRG
jgi:signal transduction histidine kinase